MDDENGRRPPEPMNRLVILLTCFSVIGGFLFGYDTGVISGAGALTQEDFGLSNFDLEMVTSITVAGAAISAAASGWPMQVYGRRPTIMVASVLYVIGALLVGVAPGLGILLLGRLVLGLGIGTASIAIPVFIAEAAPTERRGQLVGLNNLFCVFGQISACIANIVCDRSMPVSSAWRTSMGLAAFPAAIQLIGFLGLPESPRWLAQVGRSEEAISVIKLIRAGGSEEQIEADYEALQRIMQDEQHTPGISEILSNRKLRRMFHVGMGVMALQQLSGINTVMYYGTKILIMVGLPQSQSIEMSALLAIAQCVGILSTSNLFDKWGRRSLMIPSLLLASLCLALTGACFINIHSYGNAAVGFILAYLFFFGCGLSSGPWILNSEIYPVNVRGIGNSAAITTNWAFNYAISVCFLTLCDTVGRLATFVGIGVLGIFGAMWLSAFVPETKGLALEDIQKLFDDPHASSSINSPLNRVAGEEVNNPLVPESGLAENGCDATEDSASLVNRIKKYQRVTT